MAGKSHSLRNASAEQSRLIVPNDFSFGTKSFEDAHFYKRTRSANGSTRVAVATAPKHWDSLRRFFLGGNDCQTLKRARAIVLEGAGEEGASFNSSAFLEGGGVHLHLIVSRCLINSTAVYPEILLQQRDAILILCSFAFRKGGGRNRFPPPKGSIVSHTSEV